MFIIYGYYLFENNELLYIILEYYFLNCLVRLFFWLSFIATCGHQPAQYYWENLLEEDVSNFDFEQ
jgi:hypothetical protein